MILHPKDYEDAQRRGWIRPDGSWDWFKVAADVHRLKDELLQNPQAKAAHDAQKARIDARVAERRAAQSDGCRVCGEAWPCAGLRDHGGAA